MVTIIELTIHKCPNIGRLTGRLANSGRNLGSLEHSLWKADLISCFIETNSAASVLGNELVLESRRPQCIINKSSKIKIIRKLYYFNNNSILLETIIGNIKYAFAQDF